MPLSRVFAGGSVVVVVVAISLVAAPEVESAPARETVGSVEPDVALLGDAQPVAVRMRRRGMTTLVRAMPGESLRIIGRV
jgi:hypothetical protein